ncbi:MAG: glycosyltransferase family 2 protein [Candidatus Ventricola sp.]
MRITVIVPVYNAEEYLGHCIECILAQTYSDFELILIDDGSMDTSGEICDSYAQKDKRIRVVHKQNGGVAAARNTGLDMAKGEYVAFCDCDDYWNAQYLERMCMAIRLDDSELVSANYYRVDSAGRIKYISRRTGETIEIHSNEERFDYILKNVVKCASGWTVWARLFRNNIIQERNIRFCTSSANYAEDLGFVFEYSLYIRKATSISDALYYYVTREHSMMASSEDTLKLDPVNELSIFLSRRYFNVFTETNAQCQYALLHFLVLYRSEYRKILNTERYCELGTEIVKVADKRWFRKQIRWLFFSKKLLITQFGKRDAERILLFSWYCLHGNWNRFKYESAIAYRFLIEKEK